ncbi:MAG: outer membrane beta-barrel protein [Thermoanaerobaculia bacterium]|nr:outer membrane beta-barrel protein [Thermoanaerobaculia bacterium]
MPAPARFVLLLLTLALPAAAAEPGLYASFKLGTTDLEASFGGAFDQVIDGDDDSQAIEVGYRFSRHWAVQAAYHELGTVPGTATPCDPQGVCQPVVTPIAADSTAFSIAAVPQLPLGKRLSLFGKVGVAFWESDVGPTGAPATEPIPGASGEDLIWGAGVRLAIFGPLELFYEYEGIGDDFETQAFGATFQF